MDSILRPLGIDRLGDISWGTHFCLFCKTIGDLLDFFIPFFIAGLEHQEFCLWVASEPLIAKETEQAMQKAIPNFKRYLAEGQIEIIPHTDWYLKQASPLGTLRSKPDLHVTFARGLATIFLRFAWQVAVILLSVYPDVI